MYDKVRGSVRIYAKIYATFESCVLWQFSAFCGATVPFFGKFQNVLVIVLVNVEDVLILVQNTCMMSLVYMRDWGKVLGSTAPY